MSMGSGESIRIGRAPRRARRTWMWWLMGYVMAALVLAPLVLLAAILSTFRLGPLRELSAWGVETTGVVLDLRTRNTKNGRTYRVAYRFRLEDGREYQDSGRVSRERYRGLRKGEVVTVTYLPEDPRVSQPAPRDGPFMPRQITSLFVLLGVTVLLTLGMVAWIIWRMRTLDFLARDGDVAEGRVTAVKEMSARGGKQWLVTYVYRDAYGREHRKRTRAQPRHHPEPVVDQAIPVLYRRERSKVAVPVFALKPFVEIEGA